jgi:hypothetical protein
VSEVEKQAELITDCFAIVQHLSTMFVSKFSHGPLYRTKNDAELWP